MLPVCTSCGETFHDHVYACPKCHAPLLVSYDWLDGKLADEDEPGVWKYWRLLPRVEAGKRLSLGEGNTPLVKSAYLGKQLGIDELYFKLEGSNPTGSYKDRIAAVGLSWAVSQGKAACIGTSSGNAGAAAAAYAARAGIRYHLAVLEQIVPAKLSQALLHRPTVYRIASFGTDPAVGQQVFDFITEVAQTNEWEVMITAFRCNPYAMEGVKTISFEIAQRLGTAPSAVYVPAGGAGLFVGVHKGFHELHELKLTDRKPKVTAVQPEGCSNIVKAYEAGLDHPVAGPSTTDISGLQVPNPPDGSLALKIMHQGDGAAISVSDEEIYDAQRLLAEKEGIFCEPASAAAAAGLIRACQTEKPDPSAKVVCVLTGHGLKDDRMMAATVRSHSLPLLKVDEWKRRLMTGSDRSASHANLSSGEEGKRL